MEKNQELIKVVRNTLCNVSTLENLGKEELAAVASYGKYVQKNNINPQEYQKGLEAFINKAMEIKLAVVQANKRDVESKLQQCIKLEKKHSSGSQEDEKMLALITSNKDKYLEHLQSYDETILRLTTLIEQNETVEMSNEENKEENNSNVDVVYEVLNDQECASLISPEEQNQIYNAGYRRLEASITDWIGYNVERNTYYVVLKSLEESNKRSIEEAVAKLKQNRNLPSIDKSKNNIVYTYKKLIYLTGEREYLANEFKQYENNQHSYRRS